MKKTKTLVLVAASVLAAAAVAAAASFAGRSDCPGTTTCPLTGEVICVDRCPVACCASEAAQP